MSTLSLLSIAHFGTERAHGLVTTLIHETQTPRPYEVTFENEYVRMVSIQLEAGQKPPPYNPVAMPLVRVELSTGAIHYDEELVGNVSTEKVREILE